MKIKITPLILLCLFFSLLLLAYCKKDNDDPTPLPNVTTAPVVSTVTPNSIEIKWEAVDHAVKYNLYRKGVNAPIYVTDSPDKLNYTDINLTPDTEYTYYVTAVSKDGKESNPSKEIQRRTAKRPNFSQIVFNAVTYKNVTVAWKALKNTSEQIRGYKLFRNNQLIASFKGGEAEYIYLDENDLLPETEYIYQVKAEGIQGNEFASPMATVKTAKLSALSKPEAPTFDNIRQTSVTVKWQAPKLPNGATFKSYKIYRDNSTSPVTTITDATTLSFEDTGLTAGRDYAYTLVVTDNLDRESAISEEGNVKTMLPALPKPGTLTFDKVGETSVTMKWQALQLPNGVTFKSYKIYRDGSTTPVKIITDAATLSFEDTGLTADKLYKYTVSVVDIQDRESEKSQEGEVTTVLPALPTPGMPTFGIVTANSIVVNWTGIPNATEYKIYREVTGSPAAPTELGPFPATSTTINYTQTDTGLSPFTDYSYYVVAINKNGKPGTPSTKATKKTTSAKPAKPAVSTGNVNRITTSSSSIEIAWSAVSGAAKYEIHRVGYANNPLTTIDAPTLSYEDNNLTPNVEYTYFVVAIAADGVTKSDESDQFNQKTKALAAGQPVAPTFGAVTSTSIEVNWTTVANAAKYELHRVGAANNPIHEGADTNYSNIGLSPDTDYEYYIIAVDADGNKSIKSDDGRATTKSPALSKPAKPTFGTVTALSIVVNWTTASNGGASYELHRLGYTNNPIYSGTALTYTDGNLSSDTKYEYFLKVIARDGTRSPQSDNSEETTKSPSLNKPAQPTFGTVTASSIVVNWTTLSNAVNYELHRIGAASNPIYTGNDLNYTDIGLTADTDYKYSVIAVAADGTTKSQASDESTQKTISVKPNKPAAPTFGTMTASSIVVNWTTVSNASSYELHRDGATNNPIYKGSLLTYTDNNGLTADTDYKYYVIAVGADGTTRSDKSDDATKKTTLPGLPKPQKPTLDQKTETSVTVKWQAPQLPNGVNFKSYKIYRDGGASPVSTVTDATTLSFQDTGLTSGTQYTYTVSMVDSKDRESEKSEQLIVSTNQLAPLPKPQDFFFDRITSRSLKVSWKEPVLPAGITIKEYKIYRQDNGTQNVLATIQQGQGSYFEDTGLNMGTNYSYQLGIVDNSGRESRSDEISAAPANPTMPKSFESSYTFIFFKVNLTTSLTGLNGFKHPTNTISQGGEGYFSNMGSDDPIARNGQGSITKTVPSGTSPNLTHNWVTGLNSPKGLVLYNGKLWVADVDEIVEIDTRTKAIKKHAAPGATCLSGLAVDAQGNIYASNTWGPRDFNGSSGDPYNRKIYILPPGANAASVWIEGDHLNAPNGLCIEGNTMYVATYGNGYDLNGLPYPNMLGKILKIDLTTKQVETFVNDAGNLEGILRHNNGLLVTDYVKRQLIYVDDATRTATVVRSNIGSASERPSGIGISTNSTVGQAAVVCLKGGTTVETFVIK